MRFVDLDVVRLRVAEAQLLKAGGIANQVASELQDRGERRLAEVRVDHNAVHASLHEHEMRCVSLLLEPDIQQRVNELAHPGEYARSLAQVRTGIDEGLEVGQVVEG